MDLMEIPIQCVDTLAMRNVTRMSKSVWVLILGRDQLLQTAPNYR